MLRVTVDAETCTGCGACEDICPSVFRVESSQAAVLLDPVPPQQAQTCRQARDACPVEAIRVAT